MINANNLKQIDFITTNIIDIQQNLPLHDSVLYDLFSEKDFRTYISDIKREVRNSYEYHKLIKYLRLDMDMNRCSFFNAVNNIESLNIKIEIHHSPFTLDDICVIVFNKRYFFNEDISTHLVAKEVILLHYLLLVGLIPLSETVHQLVHNGYLFVPPNFVMGDYNNFKKLYEPYIEEDMLDALNSAENFGKLYIESIYNSDLLKENNIYINGEGVYSLPPMENVINCINDRITSIKNNNYIAPTEYNSTTCPVHFL